MCALQLLSLRASQHHKAQRPPSDCPSVLKAHVNWLDSQKPAASASKSAARERRGQPAASSSAHSVAATPQKRRGGPASEPQQKQEASAAAQQIAQPTEKKGRKPPAARVSLPTIQVKRARTTEPARIITHEQTPPGQFAPPAHAAAAAVPSATTADASGHTAMEIDADAEEDPELATMLKQLQQTTAANQAQAAKLATEEKATLLAQRKAAVAKQLALAQAEAAALAAAELNTEAVHLQQTLQVQQP